MSYFHQFNTFQIRNFMLVIILCRGTTFFHIFNIDDQNTKYVFASKNTLAVYLNPNV